MLMIQHSQCSPYSPSWDLVESWGKPWAGSQQSETAASTASGARHETSTLEHHSRGEGGRRQGKRTLGAFQGIDRKSATPELMESIIPSGGNRKYHPQDLHLLSTVVAGPLAGSAVTLPTFATLLHFMICVRLSTPQVLFLLRSCENEHVSGEVQ